MLDVLKKKLHVEVLDAKLGPIFEVVQLRLNCLDGLKTAFLEMLFARLDFAGRELHDVHDSKVDTADLRRTIVDQSYDSLLPVAFNRDFFFEFTLHTGSVPILASSILYGDMAADANGPKCMQSFLPLPFSSGVLKNSGPICIVTFKNYVRDKLLEGRIGFHQTSRAE